MHRTLLRIDHTYNHVVAYNTTQRVTTASPNPTSVKVPSTPTLPARSLESYTPDTTYHPTPRHILASYPPPHGVKGDVWLSESILSSPPSPSNIDGLGEQQAGGFPQSEGDDYGRSRSASQPQPRRHNLSLSIPNTSPSYNQSASPSSLASSGAPFTDSYSSQSHMGGDYFYLDPSYFPTAGDPPPTTIQPQAIQPIRAPASQPSSPVRGVYPPGQVPFLTTGRARGATFSGASNFDFTPYQQPPSALPHHLSFAAIQSPSHSPASASPLLASSAEYFGTVNPEPTEDALTPTLQHPDHDMPVEMVDKLTLLDRIVTNAQMAKQALLRGQNTEVSASLGLLSDNLEVASGLGVGPAHPTRDTSVSPPDQFSTSPTVRTSTNSLLPALPVEGAQLRRISGTAPPYNDYVQAQAPPLIHSHSFPNGHQLPSQQLPNQPHPTQQHPTQQHPNPQLSNQLAPSTPVAPAFAAAIGVGHMPMISSPLATMPVSRAPSPPRQYIETYTDDSDKTLSRRTSEARPDGRPVINRSRSASVNKTWSTLPAMTPTPVPSVWPSRQPSPEDDGDDDSEDEAPRKSKRRRSSVNKDDGPDLGFQIGSIISDDIRRQLDQIFEEFLNRVCSDLEICDSKGEKLHQVLMPKKMQRLDESSDYRPFKFRIQAFTNAFHDELLARGITEETMSAKKIKMYLWRQDLISRFNADGKKAKSKGNHIWNVDGKRLPSGGWVFRPFKRRIMGQPNAFALVHQQYEWEPRIWDPQAASDTLKPTFSSPAGTLPSWLHWEDGAKLVGTPSEPSPPISVTAIAEFVDSTGTKCTIDTSFNVQAVLPHVLNDPEAIYAQVQAQAMVQAQLQQQAAQANYDFAAQQWSNMMTDPNMAQNMPMQPVYMPSMAYPQPTYPHGP